MNAYPVALTIIMAVILISVYVIAPVVMTPGGEFKKLYIIESSEEACTPATEICDGVDNDCDSQIDEGELCLSGQGCVDGNCIDLEPLSIPTQPDYLQDIKDEYTLTSDPYFKTTGDVHIIGYTFKLPDVPVITYKINRERELAANSKLDFSGREQILQQDVLNYRSALLDKLQTANSEIKQMIADKETITYKNVFSGVSVLGISSKEAEEIVDGIDDFVGYYPMYRTEPVLMDSVPLINADDVWNLLDSNGTNITGDGIIIAVIDTGVDYTHPDLGGCFGAGCKVVGGWDFVNSDSDPMDDHGHGTHVASTAAGNGTLKGVAPDAKIIAYKVCNTINCPYTIAGIDRATDPNDDGNLSDHVDVLSLSIGTIGCPGGPDDPGSVALDNAALVGVIPVVAAGNCRGYNNIGDYAASQKAITVGASDKDDNIAGFSSRGPTSEYKVKPDVVAPGVSICAARWDSYSSSCIDDEHALQSGTSMATPHVSGATALIKQAHPDWTVAEIKYALRNTAIDIGEDILTQGYGRIDVLEAVGLENPPPIAILNTSGFINETINITGSAYGNNFDRYVLYYGEGYTPESWILLHESSNPVTGETLGILRHTNLTEEGKYTIRLRVFDSNGLISEDRSIIVFSADLEHCYSCEVCQIKLNRFGTVTLNDNINSTGTCIRIDRDDVILDCDDYTIKKNNETYYGAGAFGIKGTYRDNITIKNCNVVGNVLVKNNYGYVDDGLTFWSGISLDGYVINSKLVNNNVTLNFKNIFLFGHNNIFINNSFSDSQVGANFYVRGDDNQVDTSNKVEGKPIYYFEGIDNQIIENFNDTCNLHIYSSSNVTIKNNNIDCGDGILLYNTQDFDIKNNRIVNTVYGLYSYSGYDNIIRNNTFSNNTIGIFLMSGTRNTITDNDISVKYSGWRDWGSALFLDTLHETTIINNQIKGIDKQCLGVNTLLSKGIIINNNNISAYRGIYLRQYENNTILNNLIEGDFSGSGIYLYSNLPLLSYTEINDNIIYNNPRAFDFYITHNYSRFSIFHNSIINNSEYSIYSNFPVELSYNNQGNFWGRTESPYFCEYENQHPNCINNWDSNRQGVIDSCPYNQSYLPGEWPESPVCPTPTVHCLPGQIIGDADGDGEVTYGDADLLPPMIVDDSIYEIGDICCVDIDADGDVDIGDVIKIRRIADGLDPISGYCHACSRTVMNGECSNLYYCDDGEFKYNCQKCCEAPGECVEDIRTKVWECVYSRDSDTGREVETPRLT